MHLEIDRSDISTSRIVSGEPPALAGAGQVVLTTDKFALTANNISYALSGDMLDYWGFFPAPQGWGRLPVMGFGTVTQSAVAGVDVGGRYFGFYPAGDHHVVEAEPARNGFIDAGAHRSRHAKTYRLFEAAPNGVDAETESRILLLRGLFVTSFLCDDFLADNAMFGAEQLVITSASSKTSLALAHSARRGTAAGRVRRGHVVGLTSASNRAFVERTGLYDEVVDYDNVASIDSSTASVIVDMAGNSTVLRRLHEHLGAGLRHSCRVGATHWQSTADAGPMPGPAPQFFFAPSQIAKRGEEWGRDVLNARLEEGLGHFVDSSRDWMTVETSSGREGLERVYRSLISGAVDPAVGHIIEP